MDDRAICLPWDKNFGLSTPRTDSSLWRITDETYKRIRRYPSVSIPPGRVIEKSSIGGYPY